MQTTQSTGLRSNGAQQTMLPAASTSHSVKPFAWITSADLAADPDRRYAEAVNAPLSRATVVALRDRLKSGNYPRRKVRKRA